MPKLDSLISIDARRWTGSRAGARAGRGFRYQDVATALLAVEAWAGADWQAVIPEGLGDATLHSASKEYRVQIKSRHDPRASFRPTEVAEYIEKIVGQLTLGDLEAGRIALVIMLEREVDGITAAGLSRALGDDPQASSLLSEPLQEVAADLGTSPEIILASSYLLVVPSPADQIVAMLSKATSCAEAAARLAADRLRLLVGARADQNYSARPDKPATLNSTDVQEVLDAVLKVVDPDTLLAAVANGLCEPVGFRPIDTPGFYDGVDTVPGHVAAGLVLDRPALVDDVLDGLETRQAAIIAGPSGSGKSALGWLSAYASRHFIRWYRVRAISPDQVHLLVDLARAIEATPQRPVGFVFDDLGRSGAGSWDTLRKAIQHEPGILLLGTVREEDLYLLQDVGSTAFVRPLLNEELASRLWDALKTDRDLEFLNWREPFEISQGLMLEYVHLLTSGERLQDTIFGQVRRRLQEQRDDELAILQAVAATARLGGTVDPARLCKRLGLESIAFSRALLRLIDEHAIRQTANGTLTGLHEVRSAALHMACSRLLPRSEDEVLAEILDIVDPASFAVLLPRLMVQLEGSDDLVLEGLSERGGDLAPSALAKVFYGLGLVVCERVASRWLELLEQEGIDQAQAGLSLMLALAGSTLDVPNFARMKSLIERRAEASTNDLRSALLGRLEGFTDLEVPLPQYHELAASLAPIGLVESAPKFELLPRLEQGQVELDLALELLATLRAFNTDLAEQVAEELGGTDALLARIHDEKAWVTRPVLREEDDGLVVHSDVRLVNQLPDQNANDLVVEHCDRLLAAAPRAGIAASTLLFWNGEPAGFAGMPLAQKRLPRSASPPAVEVAWNRALIRALQRRHAAQSETARANALAGAIIELSEMVERAAELYCRGQVAKPRQDALLSIRSLLNDFIQGPKITLETEGPLAPGEASFTDDLQLFVSSITSLASDLGHGSIVRPIPKRIDVAKLNATTLAARHAAEWRWLERPPTAELEKLAQLFADLEEVLGLAHGAPDQFRALRTRAERSSRHNRALPRFAEAARQAHQLAAQKLSAELGHALDTVAPGSSIVRKPGQRDSIDWPNSEYLALIPATHLVRYLELAEDLVEAAKAIAGDHRLTLAPVRNGHVIGMLAGSVGSQFLPMLDFAEQWGALLPLPLWKEKSSASVAKLFELAILLSSTIANADRDLNQEEQAFAQQIVDRIREGTSELEKLRDEEVDPDIAAASAAVLEVLDRLRDELTGTEPGGRLAADAANQFMGNGPEFNHYLAIIRIALLERDLAAHA